MDQLKDHLQNVHHWSETEIITSILNWNKIRKKEKIHSNNLVKSEPVVTTSTTSTTSTASITSTQPLGTTTMEQRLERYDMDMDE